MSAFTTPSRANTHGATALQRGGGSSSRRVVRSALEMLMDTATPELPGRSGALTTNMNATHSNSSVRNNSYESSSAVSAGSSSSSAKGPVMPAATTRTTPSTSPFSVTYTTAAPSTRAGRREDRPSTSTAAPSATALNTSASDFAVKGRGRRSVLDNVEPQRASSQARHAEPSALAFLSPQNKAPRPSSAVGRGAALPRHRLHSTSFDKNDDDDSEEKDNGGGADHRGDEHVARAHASNAGVREFHKGKHSIDEALHRRPEQPSKDLARSNSKKKNRNPSSSNLDADRAATAPAPVSPSRSLYLDVEAAQQQQQQQPSVHRGSRDVEAPSPSSASVSLDTSFVEDSEDDLKMEEAFEDGDEAGSEDDASDNDLAANRRSTIHRRGPADEEKVNGSFSQDKVVPAAEVQSLIQAALRRYEQARDAEEETVLQQVSEEVEAQATRYAELAAAHSALQAEKAELLKELQASRETCSTLERAALSARQTQQVQREAMKRLEVELYHARDAQQQIEHSGDAAASEWAVARRRYEKRHATLEAQLSQLREEVDEKDAHIAELNTQLSTSEAELTRLRQRSEAQAAAVEDEYGEIHQRMLRLGQNMASMESTLRERDAVIAELRAQLDTATAAAAQHADAQGRAEQLEREKAELADELARARESLQRQTDEVRRRMHRLTIAEQQRDALKGDVAAARQAMAAAADDHARVVTALQSLKEEFAKGADISKSSRGSGQKSEDAPGSAASKTAASRAKQSAVDPDETLVYEGDSEEEETRSDYSSLSETDSVASITHSQGSEGEEKGEDSEGAMSDATPPKSRRQRRAAEVDALPPKTSAQKRAAPPQQQPGKAVESSRLVDESTRGAKATPASTPAKDVPSIKRLAQALHHSVARARLLVRELQRCVVTALAKQRSPSPATTTRTPRSRSNSSGNKTHSSKPAKATAMEYSLDLSTADAVDRASKRRSTSRSSTSSLERSGHAAVSEPRRDLVQKLELACRYLKSELRTAQSTLHEAQTECQWRTLTMAKWEADLQAARREVLALEKDRLAYTTEKEALELTRQELAAQLAEAQQSCAAAMEKATAAQAALEEVTTSQGAAQEQVDQLTAAKAAAETALEKEQAKTSRLTAKVAELTAAQSSLADEHSLLQEKHKAALSQLQTFRAQEATQQLRDQHEGRSRGAELTELRAAVAQLRVAERAWEAERTRLTTAQGALHRSVERLEAEADVAARRCAAVEAAAALQADLETTTLTTIASIVQAPPPSPLLRSAASKEDRTGAFDGSPTEKKLFDADEEPSVEEVTVEEDGAALATAVRARLRHQQQQQQQQQQLAGTPAQRPSSSHIASRARGDSSGKKQSLSRTAGRSNGKPVVSSMPSRSPPAKDPHTSIAADESLAEQHLPVAQLRQHVVAAVQRAALELAQLQAAVKTNTSTSAFPRTAAYSSHSSTRRGPVPSTSTANVKEEEDDDHLEESEKAVVDAWFGAAGTFHSTSPDSPYVAGQEVPLLHYGSPSTASVARTPPQLHQLHSSPSSRPRTAQDNVHVHLSSSTNRTLPAASAASHAQSSTPGVANRRPQQSTDAVNSPSPSPSPLHARQHPTQQPYVSSVSPQRLHALPTSAAHSPASEHVYNVSPWTPSRELWSPPVVAPPPPPHAGARWADGPSVKVWSEVRRSSSMEDGLSGYSNSATRGEVDGSASPARPPSLCAHSQAR